MLLTSIQPGRMPHLEGVLLTSIQHGRMPHLEGEKVTEGSIAAPLTPHLKHEHIVHQHLHAFLEVLSPLPKAGQEAGLLRAHKSLQLPQQAPLHQALQHELLSSVC